jgi:hypothetical protein
MWCVGTAATAAALHRTAHPAFNRLASRDGDSGSADETEQQQQEREYREFDATAER